MARRLRSHRVVPGEEGAHDEPESCGDDEALAQRLRVEAPSEDGEDEEDGEEVNLAEHGLDPVGAGTGGGDLRCRWGRKRGTAFL